MSAGVLLQWNSHCYSFGTMSGRLLLQRRVLLSYSEPGTGWLLRPYWQHLADSMCTRHIQPQYSRISLPSLSNRQLLSDQANDSCHSLSYRLLLSYRHSDSAALSFRHLQKYSGSQSRGRVHDLHRRKLLQPAWSFRCNEPLQGWVLLRVRSQGRRPCSSECWQLRPLSSWLLLHSGYFHSNCLSGGDLQPKPASSISSGLSGLLAGVCLHDACEDFCRPGG